MTEGTADDGAGTAPAADLHLLAVFRTRAEALEAERQLHDAGLDPRTVRVGSEGDRDVALRAEITGGSGYPKDTAKGLIAVAVPVTIIGALIGLPFGFLH